MSLRIFVFERKDGTLWADYSEAFAKRAGVKIVHTIVAETRAEMEGVIKEPGLFLPERVRALAERGLSEFMARGQQPEPPPARAPRAAPPTAATEAKPRPWWRRLFAG